MTPKRKGHQRMIMDDADLPGGNWDHGPHLERISGRYHTPVIVEDASSIRGKVGVRAAYVADYTEVHYSNPVTDGVASLLRRISLHLGMGDVHVQRKDQVDLDALRDYGAVIEEGPRGLWLIVRNLAEVKDALEGDG
jgi:hypothetical protein